MKPVGREVAKPATIVAAARGDQARRGQELAAGEEVATGRGIVAIRRLAIAPLVTSLEPSRVDVAQNPPPKLNPFADRQRVGVGSAVVGARQDVQPAENDLGAAIAVPTRERVRPLREGQVNADADDLRERLR